MNTQSKKAIYPQGKDSSSGVYSPGLIAGNLVFVSGQVAKDIQTGNIIDGDIQKQTEVTLNNVKDILQEAGCTLDDCVKVTVHLSSLDDFGKFNESYEKFFTKPYPTRTTVQSGLANVLVEIDVIAIKNN